MTGHYIIPKDIRELRPETNRQQPRYDYIIPKDIRELRHVFYTFIH